MPRPLNICFKHSNYLRAKNTDKTALYQDTYDAKHYFKPMSIFCVNSISSDALSDLTRQLSEMDMGASGSPRTPRGAHGSPRHPRYLPRSPHNVLSMPDIADDFCKCALYKLNLNKCALFVCQ